MRYLSVCSGIEAATVAWHPLGWTPVAFAEIEPFCASVLQHHYPTVPNLGDFTQIHPEQIAALGGVDLLVGGTPCQDYSIAGGRAGLDGARGNLTLDFCDLAHDLTVPWVVWENVPGVFSIDCGRTFARIIGALTGWEPAVPGGGWRGAGAAWGPRYALAWRVLDAQHFGVPQRRRRVFLVARRDGNWRRCVAALWHLAGADDAGAWRDHARASVLSLSAMIGTYAPSGWRKATAYTSCAPVAAATVAGGCVTLRMTETPAPAPSVPTQLRDALEPGGAHLLRYTLTAVACTGILNRALLRGKQLPAILDTAIRDGCVGTVTDLNGDPASAPVFPILEATARVGERDPRRAGLGIGAAGAPMYTLEATNGHGVAQPLAFAH